jgi:hypothetical protein
MTEPNGQGNDRTCCIQGRECNKIAEQLVATQEWTVLHGFIC